MRKQRVAWLSFGAHPSSIGVRSLVALKVSKHYAGEKANSRRPPFEKELVLQLYTGDAHCARVREPDRDRDRDLDLVGAAEYLG